MVVAGLLADLVLALYIGFVLPLHAPHDFAIEDVIAVKLGPDGALDGGEGQ